MMGRKSKSEMLLQCLHGPDPALFANSHGHAYLRSSPALPRETVLLDFELQGQSKPKQLYSCTGSSVSSPVDWLENFKTFLSRRQAGNLIAGRALSPMCNAVCYFASDLGGTSDVAQLLADLIKEEPSSDLPLECLPRVVVIVETSLARSDCVAAEAVLMDDISSLVQASAVLKNIHLPNIIRGIAAGSKAFSSH